MLGEGGVSPGGACNPFGSLKHKTLMILLGHPTGNPISHQCALAYIEKSQLEAFCTPWFPEGWQIEFLRRIPGISREVARLTRRRFEPIAKARKVQGMSGEFGRMARRLCGLGNEGISYEANDWLMRTMARECLRSSVTQVHSYEDCSLWQFESAKHQGKRCIYDMPIGYYGWWQKKRAGLIKKYGHWISGAGEESVKWARPEQKKKEMELADIVLTPSTFSRRTILEYFDKQVFLTPYGMNAMDEDDGGWQGDSSVSNGGGERPFRIIFAGTCSVRKGTPMLLEVWRDLAWRDAELILAGSWKLAASMKAMLPKGVRYVGILDAASLRGLYQTSDWLILPSNFEGYGLVILEALALGLPVLASDATGAPDLPAGPAVQIFPADDRDALVACLESCRRFGNGELRAEARATVRNCGWRSYRRSIQEAVGILKIQD